MCTCTPINNRPRTLTNTYLLIHVLIVLTLLRSTHLQVVPKATLTQCTHRPVQVYPPSGCPQSHPYPVYTQTSTGLPTFRISPKPPLPSVQTHRPVQVYPSSGHPQSHPYSVYTQTCTGLSTFRTSPKPPLPSVHTDQYRTTHFQHITKATLAQCAYRPVQVYPPSGHPQNCPYPVYIHTDLYRSTHLQHIAKATLAQHAYRPVQVYPPSGHPQNRPCPACTQHGTPGSAGTCRSSRWMSCTQSGPCHHHCQPRCYGPLGTDNKGKHDQGLGSSNALLYFSHRTELLRIISGFFRRPTDDLLLQPLSYNFLHNMPILLQIAQKYQFYTCALFPGALWKTQLCVDMYNGIS